KPASAQTSTSAGAATGTITPGDQPPAASLALVAFVRIAGHLCAGEPPVEGRRLKPALGARYARRETRLRGLERNPVGGGGLRGAVTPPAATAVAGHPPPPVTLPVVAALPRALVVAPRSSLLVPPACATRRSPRRGRARRRGRGGRVGG